MDTITLLCLRDFNEAGIAAKAGDVLTLAPGVANRLLDSWPAAWSVAPDDPEAEAVLDSRLAEIETEAIEAPAKDKMIHAPARAKARAEVNIERRARARGALKG